MFKKSKYKNKKNKNTLNIYRIEKGKVNKHIQNNTNNNLIENKVKGRDPDNIHMIVMHIIH